jgi:thiamine-monophosphate kinase
LGFRSGEQGLSVAGRPGEFELIARLFAPLAKSPGAFGLTDDAAIISPFPGHDLVVTTDAILESVDFFGNDPPASVAKKALRVNLSDLAAKGATPFGYLLTLALPQRIDATWLEDFARGLRDDQDAYDVGLLGGDMSSSEQLSISITAFGYVPAGRLIRRKGARAGDTVFVTGTIGDSGGGLALLRDDEGGALGAEFRNDLIDRYRLPAPPVSFGRSLIGLASAALDVSDGLIADLGHLAAASDVRIVVEAARIPRSAALRALWGDSDAAIARAATSGDDYQIAFTAPLNAEAKLQQAAHDGLTALTRIGRVEAGAGVVLVGAQAQEIAVKRPGFTHF